MKQGLGDSGDDGYSGRIYSKVLDGEGVKDVWDT